MAECRGPRFGSKCLLCSRGHLRGVSFEPDLDRFSMSCHRTVPEACGLLPSTEIDADLAAILGPGAAVRHPQKASQGRSGTPGAENSARSSGLQRICCILSETHGSGAVAQNGLGLGAGLTEPSNQRAPRFRVERPRPRSCWAVANK